MPSFGSSPHTRGALVPALADASDRRIIPAYAGSTSVWPLPGTSSPDHPRIRGEHAVFVGGLSVGVGSSPHTRGAPSRRRLLTKALGIIPAYAGSTSPVAGHRAGGRDHPRIRGEHRRCHRRVRRRVGSSPHTRGAPPNTGASDTRSTDHPRIRGEHRREFSEFGREFGIIPAYAGSTGGTGIAQGADNGSSPHTRGAPRPIRWMGRRWRIIPAYAGSTPTKPKPSDCRRDHPRIRGEHYLLSDSSFV